MLNDRRPLVNGLAASLGRSKLGYRGRVKAIEVHPQHCDLPEDELERRLIELGFTEGAHVEILHEGLFSRDPIAVRVNNNTVAIRRREAMAIVVEALESR
jgi:ferrous iron transport protein A